MTKVSGAPSVARVMLREPLLHFALLGAGLFALNAFAQRSEAPPQAPPTGQHAAEPSRVIRLGDADFERLRETFRNSWKRDPSVEQLGDLTEAAIADEILFREGSARGLDRDDAIVRQRVIEKMRTLVRPATNAQPGRAELERWFATYPHRFVLPPRVAFDQIYFDPKRRAARGEDASVVAAGVLASADPSQSRGDDFVLSRHWNETPEPQIVNVFGDEFAKQLMAAPLERWMGPWSSEYGVHLVRVTSRQPQRTPGFQEMEGYVRADFMLAQAQGQAEVERSYLPKYRIELQGQRREPLANSAALRAVLKGARP